MLHHNRPKSASPPRRWPDDTPKPKLPAIHLPIYRVHYTALEEYLVKVYQMREYDFLVAAGCVPGTVPQYEVRGELPPAWDGAAQANRIRAGQRTRNVALILNVLCIDGFIPAGTYIIDTKPRPAPIELYRRLLYKTRDPHHAECVQFRQTHREPEFQEQASLLDKAVLEWQKSQTE
jgi:hypothetical protein